MLLRRRLASSGLRSVQLIVKTTSTIFYEALEEVAINLLSKQLCKTDLLIILKNWNMCIIQLLCSFKDFYINSFRKGKCERQGYPTRIIPITKENNIDKN